MHVTINSGEGTRGKLQQPEYWVDLTVAFSEEEKAIIKKRNLGPTDLFNASTQPSQTTADNFMTSGMSGVFAVLFVVLGLWTLHGALMKQENPIVSALFLFTLFVALPATIYLRSKRMHRAMSQNIAITINRLLNGTLRMYAYNPLDAKVLDQTIREHMPKLKRYIEENRDVAAPSSFEL